MCAILTCCRLYKSRPNDFTPAPVQRVTDTRIVSSEPLPSPVELTAELPRTEKQVEFVAQARQEIHRIIHGEDPRLIFVVGPCSIHDLKAGREYAEKLKTVADELSDRLLILMRVYFEKPRTTTGWKGLIMDPHLNGTYEIPTGLRIAREFLGEVLDLGMPTATELLDPITPQYIADSLCWAAIGARTVESQTHRQMASGLSMPVGFKNSTAGDCDVAVNAIVAATQQQTFLGITPEGRASAVTTSGNPDCQIILRGGSNGPNYASEHVADAVAKAEKAGVIPSLMIDCSHGNSSKDPERQPAVLEDVMQQVTAGNRHIHSVMMESNLKAGSQKVPANLEELEYGVSITDGCLDWATTEKALRDTHAALAKPNQLNSFSLWRRRWRIRVTGTVAENRAAGIHRHSPHAGAHLRIRIKDHAGLIVVGSLPANFHLIVIPNDQSIDVGETVWHTKGVGDYTRGLAYVGPIQIGRLPGAIGPIPLFAGRQIGGGIGDGEGSGVGAGRGRF